MCSAAKYIFTITVFFACLSFFAKAQKTPSVLPSLFEEASKNGNAESAIRQRMFVKVLADKGKVFVGEPILAIYKFYVDMNLYDYPSVIKQPEFEGWSVKELNFKQSSDIETLNNVVYSVYTIRKVQLTPLQEGSLSLGKAYVNNIVTMLESGDSYRTNEYNITVSNTEDLVKVYPLPEKNKPKNFYGVTGVFDIEAHVAENSIAIDENNKLIITIKGAGGVDAITKPEIAWPDNTEHFDGTDSQHINQDNFPVTGDRIFVVPFVGKATGNIVIPPIEFSFFNSSTNNYQTVSTDSISVTFTKALDKKDEFTNVINYDITNRRYLWIVPAIAVTVAFIGFISYRRNNKLKIKNTKPVTNTTAAPVFVQPQTVYKVKYRTDFSRYLSELKTITESKLFFAKAKNLLTRAVAERIDSNQYSEHILLEELVKRTYNAPMCNKIASLYEAINLNLYAPFQTETDLNFYFSELKNTVEELQAES